MAEAQLLDTPTAQDLAHQGGVLIGVHDSGPGIPVEERGLIFARFNRGEAGRRRSAGVGLGLFIAHSVIERHRGYLWVGDNRLGGSTFWCLLPLQGAELDNGESIASSEPYASAHPFL
jgi:signal transduction histidine kinase